MPARRNVLTTKQQAFVKEYLVDFNATQAAIRAGYSAKTANEIGAQNLVKISVSQAIAAGLQKRERENDVTVERVKEEWAKLAFSDMRDFATWGPGGVKLVDSAKLGAKSRCVKEVSESSFKGERIITFKLHDKVSALDKLARHLGMYAESDGRAMAQGAIAVEMFRKMMTDAEAPANMVNVTPKNGTATLTIEDVRSGD